MRKQMDEKQNVSTGKPFGENDKINVMPGNKPERITDHERYLLYEEIVYDLVGNHDPEIMREDLRDMIDNFFIYRGKAPKKYLRKIHFTYQILDAALRKAEHLRRIPNHIPPVPTLQRISPAGSTSK